jgi:hypothetical protein
MPAIEDVHIWARFIQQDGRIPCDHTVLCPFCETEKLHKQCINSERGVLIAVRYRCENCGRENIAQVTHDR